jgi:hypothetical protein
MSAADAFASPCDRCGAYVEFHADRSPRYCERCEVIVLAHGGDETCEAWRTDSCTWCRENLGPACRNCGVEVGLFIGLPVSINWTPDLALFTISTDICEAPSFGTDDLTCACRGDDDTFLDDRDLDRLEGALRRLVARANPELQTDVPAQLESSVVTENGGDR